MYQCAYFIAWPCNVVSTHLAIATGKVQCSAALGVLLVLVNAFTGKQLLQLLKSKVPVQGKGCRGDGGGAEGEDCRLRGTSTKTVCSASLRDSQ